LVHNTEYYSTKRNTSKNPHRSEGIVGKTIYEKILARASGEKDVSPGDVVWCRPDLIVCTDQNWIERSRFFDKVGLRKITNPEKIVAVIDHCAEQLAEPEGAENNRAFRDWARKEGITAFYDVGKGGLAVQVLVEKGHVLPGRLVIQDDPEGEACGALGAFVKGGEDIMTAMAIDEWWFEVRETVGCHVYGTFGKGVSSADLRYRLLADLGSGYSKFLEFSGPAIGAMSMDERVNLCSSLYLSESYGIIAADEKTIEYVRRRANSPFEQVVSDKDASYSDVIEYDVSDLAPQVVLPGSPNNGKPVSEREGAEIQEASLGTCASGRIDDLRVAAQILRGRKVAEGVRMYITPVSQESYLNALREGLIEVFVEAGAAVSFPSCGTCPGHIGRLAAGETCISTGIVNYAGRMGSREADIYLAGAATVAASAVAGRIADPRGYL
jgi:3-isopropylmalate/(R)-2-methylmalate dehydratase large subunit